MAKNASLLGIITWIVGVLVSLAVGFGMTDNGPLSIIPIIPTIVVNIAGWIVIIGTIIGVVMAVVQR